jgi:hypothetical protein
MPCFSDSSHLELETDKTTPEINVRAVQFGTMHALALSADPPIDPVSVTEEVRELIDLIEDAGFGKVHPCASDALNPF